MDYTFVADRKVAFIVQAGGRRKLIEFGDRNENGVSSFFTTDAKVAQAVRKHSLSRRGAIVETTRHLEEEPVQEFVKPQPAVRTVALVKGVGAKPVHSIRPTGKISLRPKAPAKPSPKKTQAVSDAVGGTSGEVREYANYTVAREAICKEFSVPKSKVRNPTALAQVAKEHGFSIKYLNAEK